MRITKYKATRRTIQAVACFVLAPLLVAQQAASSVTTPTKTGKPIVLKKGTDVHLVLLESVSSATATKGQSVHMAVLDDVTDGNGVIVIPKGTSATDVADGVIKAVPGKGTGAYRSGLSA
jgi:hypothetical protein